MRDERINIALQSTISRERLQGYLSQQGENLDAAIAVYEWNMLLAEAFYVPLQCLEVCLRNKIHDRMSEVYGADWLTSARPHR